LHAADLREVKDPAAIAKMFPPAAKVRVVNIWATWCVPCVEEMPVLSSIDRTFGDEVAMLGITLDDMIPGDRTDTKKRVASFLDAKHVAFPNAYYTGSSDALADQLRIDGAIPVTIIYDGRGNELWRLQGTLDRDDTIRKIREFLRRKP
jgi:thiol-disulfide isomerase/thioredoxin